MIGIISFVLLGIIGPSELPSIVLIIILAIVAIRISQDAKKRGMNSVLWGLFAFFFWIIAIPLYFILRKPKDGTLRRYNGGLNERIGRR